MADKTGRDQEIVLTIIFGNAAMTTAKSAFSTCESFGQLP
jgi:hypothetical protein